MKKRGRYKTSGLLEDQYMEGSGGKVLCNLLNINSKQKIDSIETELLYELTDQLLDEFEADKAFSAADIKKMHHRWLGTVYEWAGTYRQVTMSKGNFMFAAPAYIDALMQDFEKTILGQYTPCNFTAREETITALAIVHTELILIHPFREGNGRIARLLATLMALQAGLPLLDFSDFEKRRQQEYFSAVQCGMSSEYKPMEKVFRDVIALSLRGKTE